MLKELAWARSVKNLTRETRSGEPQLGKRGLYPDITVKGSADDVRVMMDMISYCERSLSLFEIAEMIDSPFWLLRDLMKPLIEERLIKLA